MTQYCGNIYYHAVNMFFIVISEFREIIVMTVRYLKKRFTFIFFIFIDEKW